MQNTFYCFKRLWELLVTTINRFMNKFYFTLCVIGIEGGGNAERQEFSRRGKFRAQISVLPVTNLFHGFAKCGTCLELGQVGTSKFGKNSPKIGGWG